MSLLIGFGNKARHGKDSAATAILEHIAARNLSIARHYDKGYALPAAQFRFAEALYKEARELHGMTEKDAPLLQQIGSQRRSENENYWVNKVSVGTNAFFAAAPHGVVIITDVRYKNEAAWIKANGGFLINVSRYEADGSLFVAPDRPANHPSEVELDGYNWDYYIRTRSGEQALAAELAITHFEYLRGLTDGR